MLFYYPFSSDLPSISFPKFIQYQAWANSGKAMKDKGAKVSLPYKLGIGYFGLFAGPEVYVIDAFGVTDPFLARLMVPEEASSDFKPGHVLRDMPNGYVESLFQNENLIKDRDLREYYEKLTVITRGRLFSLKRLRYIIEFNLGGSNRYDKEVKENVYVPGPGVYLWR
jgi:arabinofuranosyltransferase